MFIKCTPDEYELNKTVLSKLIGQVQFKFVTSRKVPVLCVTTGEVFESQTEAGVRCHTNPANIAKCCQGKLRSAGKDFEGNKLQWRYYVGN